MSAEEQLKLAADKAGTGSNRATQVTHAVETINTAAADVRKISADMQWTGSAAASAQEAFSQLATKMNNHADALASVNTADLQARQALEAAATHYDNLPPEPSPEQFNSTDPNSAPAAYKQQQARDAAAQKGVTQLNGSMGSAEGDMRSNVAYDMGDVEAGRKTDSKNGGYDNGGGYPGGSVPGGGNGENGYAAVWTGGGGGGGGQINPTLTGGGGGYPPLVSGPGTETTSFQPVTQLPPNSPGAFVDGPTNGIIPGGSGGGGGLGGLGGLGGAVGGATGSGGGMSGLGGLAAGVGGVAAGGAGLAGLRAGGALGGGGLGGAAGGRNGALGRTGLAAADGEMNGRTGTGAGGRGAAGGAAGEGTAAGTAGSRSAGGMMGGGGGGAGGGGARGGISGASSGRYGVPKLGAEGGGAGGRGGAGGGAAGSAGAGGRGGAGGGAGDRERERSFLTEEDEENWYDGVVDED